MLSHFTGSAVLMRDGSELLHPWLQGWYGELVFEASRASRLPREPADDASSGALKVLQLSLTEAFYLAFLVPDMSPRLSVESSCGPSSIPLSEPEAWLAFSAAQPRFAHNLAALCALRQAGWCVRCGLKYGADFALYAADGEFAAPAAPLRLLPHHRACRPTTAPTAPPPAPHPWAAGLLSPADERSRKHATFCALVHAPALGDHPGSWPRTRGHKGTAYGPAPGRQDGSIHDQWRLERAALCRFERAGSSCSSTVACADRVSNPVYPGCNPTYPGSRCSSTRASADRSLKGCSCAPSRRQGVSPHLLKTTARPLAWAGWR